jgi:alkaline phosphatase D
MRANKNRILLRSTACSALGCVLFAGLLATALNAQVRSGWNRDNTSQQQEKPYVVLVGLDGFRSDYAEKHHALRLQALGREGVHTSLLPVFPSLTFPNFYSMATGLYPQNHGIVDMGFYDPQEQRSFRYRDDASDGTWYKGVPIWALAQRNGMRSASFFWVGSDAEIGGQRPSYYVPFDDKIPNEARAAQVIAWLRLPPAQRPHLITVYFGDADDVGHEFGPDSAEMGDAVQRLDGVIGDLAAQIRLLKLPVNLLVVSDHGMVQLNRTGIALADYLGDADMPTKRRLSAFNLYADSAEQAERWYAALKDKDPRVEVYRRVDVPKDLHYSASPRIGDIVLLRKEPLTIFPRSDASEFAKWFERHRGEHGFEPRLVPEMDGIFYGQGPNIKAGARIGPVENIEVYPLVARILRLKIEGQIDARGELANQIYRR